MKVCRQGYLRLNGGNVTRPSHTVCQAVMPPSHQGACNAGLPLPNPHVVHEVIAVHHCCFLMHLQPVNACLKFVSNFAYMYG